MPLAWETLDSEFAQLEDGHGRTIARARDRLVDIPAGAERDTWALAVESSAWFWQGGLAQPCPPDFAAGLPTGSPSMQRAAHRICSVMEWASIIDLDSAGLVRWIAVHRNVCDLAEGTLAGIAVRMALCWKEVLDGGQPVQAADAVRGEAKRAGLSARVVEATALGALALLGGDDTTRALALARRAALMARTEGLPQQEFLASLVLARVRRHAGQSFLAVRILSVLNASMTWRWRGWAAWELLLAGGTGDALPDDGLDESRTTRAAVVLRSTLGAALRGDTSGFGSGSAMLAERVRDCPLLRFEAEAIVIALDAGRPPSAALQSWCQGETSDCPAVLRGLAIVDPNRRPDVAGRAYVVAQPGSPGRRVLALGGALFEREHPTAARLLSTGEAADSGQSGERAHNGHEERTLAAVAALVLAGPSGQTLSDFFLRVYGFSFVTALHEGTLRMLLHRLRKAVAGIGEVRRDNDRVALDLVVPVVVADPRGAQPPETRIVSYLASTGAVSTESAADHLGLPLRTARAILSRLVAAGVCDVVRDGRRVKYKIDDTVVTHFTPITSLDAL